MLAEQWTMKPVFDALRVMRGVSTAVAATVLAVTGDMRRFRRRASLWPILASSLPSIPAAELYDGATLPRPATTKFAAFWFRRLGPIASLRAWGAERSRFIMEPARTSAPSHGKRRCASMRRYRRLTMRGKSAQVALTAIARELVAFIWEMAQAVPMTT